MEIGPFVPRYRGMKRAIIERRYLAPTNLRYPQTGKQDLTSNTVARGERGMYQLERAIASDGEQTTICSKRTHGSLEYDQLGVDRN